MGNANPNDCELRAPSIKGAMRFWWRAMHGNMPIDKLREKEEEIFGGTEKGRSKVIVRVDSSRLKISKSSYKEEIWDNIKKAPKAGKEGEAYLFYSLLMQHERRYYNGIFQITLSSASKKDLLECSDAFFLLSFFGGVGSRSRRGGGNFYIKKVTDNQRLLSQDYFIENDKDLKIYITNFLKIISNKYNIKSSTKTPDFCNLSNCKIYLIENKDLNFIGIEFKNFRDRKPKSDYNGIKTFLQNGEVPQSFKKAIFGLPLSYRYGSIYDRKNAPSALIEAISGKDVIDRSASSLFFRKQKNFFIILDFHTVLLPKNSSLLIKDTTQKKVISEIKKEYNILYAKKESISLNYSPNSLKQDFIDSIKNINLIYPINEVHSRA